MSYNANFAGYRDAWFGCSDALKKGNPTYLNGEGSGMDCAVREIERLQSEVKDLRKKVKRLQGGRKPLTNNERADYGARAIENGSPDVEVNGAVTNIIDALANIMHFCHQDDYDFDECVFLARGHFDTEVAEENEDHQ